MTLWLAAAGVGTAWLLGYAWGPVLDHLNGAGRAGAAYGLGLTWLSIVMAAAAVLGWPLTPMAGGALVTVPAAAWWVGWRLRIARRGRPPRPIKAPPRNDGWWWGGVGLMGALWLVVAVRSIVKPILGWDALASYSLKARVIFAEGAVPASMFEWISTPNYPLGVPLQEVWVAWFVGSWDEVAVKLLFPAYVLALWFVVYGALRERFPARHSIAGTLFVATLPLVLQHGQDAYLDLPLAYFVLAGQVAMTRYAGTGRGAPLCLASACAVGATWTREDGLIPVLVNGLLLAWWIARSGRLLTWSGWRDLGAYLGPSVVMWFVWSLTKARLGVSSNLTMFGFSQVFDPDRFRIVVTALVRGLFLQGNWLILWALFIVGWMYSFSWRPATDDLFLAWPVVLFFAAIVVLAQTTTLFDYLDDETVLNRLVLHVAPLAALWVALAYGRWSEHDPMPAGEASRA